MDQKDIINAAPVDGVPADRVTGALPGLIQPGVMILTSTYGGTYVGRLGSITPFANGNMKPLIMVGLVWFVEIQVTTDFRRLPVGRPIKVPQLGRLMTFAKPSIPSSLHATGATLCHINLATVRLTPQFAYFDCERWELRFGPHANSLIESIENAGEWMYPNFFPKRPKGKDDGRKT